MASDEEVKNEEEITAQNKEQVDYKKKYNDLLDEGLNLRQKTTDQLKLDIQAMERQAALYEKLGNSEDARKLKLEQAAAIEQEKLRLITEQIAKGEIQGPEAAKLLQTQKAQVEQAQYLVDKLNNATEAIRDGRAAADGLGKSLGTAVVSGDLKSIFNVDNMVKLAQTMRTLDTSAATFGMALAGGLLSSFVSKLIELALAVDEAESGFKRATGASDSMAKSLTANYEETRRLGVSLEEMSSTMQSLYTSYTDFTMINQSAQKEIAKTGALLGEIGVGADDFSKGMQCRLRRLV